MTVSLLDETGADNVGGGQRGVGTTPTGRAVAIAMTHPFGVGNAHFRVRAEPGPVDTVYLGTYPRSTLTRLRGFNEAMIRNQDYVLNHRLLRPSPHGGLHDSIDIEGVVAAVLRLRPGKALHAA